MTEQDHELRWITLTGKHTGNPYATEIIEVIPTGDEWLLAPERIWEEVDEVLEGRLQVLQDSFTFDREPTKIAKSYGLERAASGNMATFLAYVELLDEYRLSHNDHEGIAKTSRNEYESAKDEIKRSKLSNGKKAQRIDQLWKIGYNPTIQAETHLSQQSWRMQDLILRKAVIDIFSSERSMMGDLSRIIEEAKEIFAGNPNSINQSLKDRQPIDYFINALAEYMTDTQDLNIYTQFIYRKSPNLISTKQDCMVIDTALSFALEPDSKSASLETKKQLGKLGFGLFKLLKRRATYLSQSGQNERYPCLSLLYDILTIVFYRSNPLVLKESARFIDSLLADLVHSSIVKREISEAAQRYAQLAVPAYESLPSDEDLLVKPPSVQHIVNTLPRTVISLLSSDEYRLLIGFIATDNLSKKQPSLIKRSSALKEVARFTTKQPRFLTMGISNPIDSVLFYSLLSQLPFVDIFSSRGIEVDLNILIQRTILDRNVPITNANKVAYERRFRETMQRYQDRDHLISDREVFFNYLVNYWHDFTLSPEDVEGENNFLWNNILNNARWFISPRGDRFSQRKDPQLQEREIESITYYIDRDFPREHKAAVRLARFNRPLEFWLDTQRGLVGSSRQILVVEPFLKEAFTNMLLKRLYFITSGLSTQETELHGGEPEDAHSLEFKRAHYRFLTSTTTRPITMESHGAQVHAKEVREDYGIDIFGEIRRRRAIGTLEANQYLTFVRETQPDNLASHSLMPNELRYDPALIQIPI